MDETTLCNDLHFSQIGTTSVFVVYKMDFKSYVKPNLPVQSGILRT